MSYFTTFYLDKEKDIVVDLDMENNILSYCIYTKNYNSDNVIKNLANIAYRTPMIKNGKLSICGDIPCYIKGDGKKVYIFRLCGTKLANIYPDGTIEVNSVISAIAKTLMSQTKDYRYSFRETLLKSYVKEDIKLSTDLHTHANANLNADILIALAIKHQIRYPLYYIKKLQLTLSKKQEEYLQKERSYVSSTIDVGTLRGKHLNRKIDDYTYINFADLILNNLENAQENINKIRKSLMILKDSQAVFTNLEKLYLYRYVFTKGIKAAYEIPLTIPVLPDKDIPNYLNKMLKDKENEDYKNNTLYEDKLLWTAREYQKRHIKYVEISDTTLVKKDESAALLLAQIHRILPLIKKETGVDIRFLAAIRRIPLTIVKDNIHTSNYLSDALSALKIISKDPYVVGSDFVGEEINDIEELQPILKEIVQQIASKDPNWTIRIHAGENDSLKTNMEKSIRIVEDALLENQKFPNMRIGHGLYCASLRSKQGKALLAKLKEHDVILEFQLTSNVRLNNLVDLKAHPLKTYLKHDISCVMGTDGYGLYGTDSIDEQLALLNFLKVSEEDFYKMKQVENKILQREQDSFIAKQNTFLLNLKEQDVFTYYKQALTLNTDYLNVDFAIDKKPSYPFFKQQITELPWDKYPIIIAGGSFGNISNKLQEQDKELILSLLHTLDPKKVFFVIGHTLKAQEKFLVENNTRFDIYSIIPALMNEKQMKNLAKEQIKGIRISSESQEMGIYKSFNYEIFERRNCVLFAFDGNSAMANLIQEAMNGKGMARIYIYPKSSLLKAKASSLKGYVSMNPPLQEVLTKLSKVILIIGEKK